MSKHVLILGVLVASLGSLSLSQALSPAQDGGEPSGSDRPVAPDEPPAAEPVARGETESTAVLGVSVRPVPAALAAQLGLAPGAGLLVQAVEPASRAAAAGLAPYDVILAIDGEAARLSLLDRAEAGEAGLELAVIRAGVEKRVAIPAANEPTGFLSTAHLGPEHPFRRLGAIAELRERYSSRAEDYSERMRALEQDSREAREEARREIAALQQACDEEVAEYVAARQREMLAMLDQHVNEELVAGFEELGVDLARAVPGARLEATEEVLGRTGELLRGGLRERLEAVMTVGEGADDHANRARNAFDRLQNELNSLFTERVQRPWASGVAEIAQHEKRLGPQHAERVERTAKTLRQINTHLHERITCAYERTQAELSKALARRLNGMEVPRTGEVETALADVQAQIDTMTRRFIHRTETAVARFVHEMQEANDEHVPAMGAHLVACEEAAGRLEQSARGLVVSRVEERPFVLDGSWQARSAFDEHHDALRAGLRAAVNDARNGMRAGSVGLVQDLREHRVAAEDAWRDLQQLLGEIRGQAESNCWKLDGPHLDGRFPRPQIGESAGEVVMR